MDGTLLQSDHTISERTLKCLRNIHAKGIHIVLISARPPIGIIPYADILQIPVFIAAYNGAYVIADDRSSVWRDNRLSIEWMNDIIPFLRTLSRRLNISIYLKDRWIVETVDQHILSEHHITKMNYESIDSLENLNDLSAHKILVMGEPTDIEQAVSLLSELFGAFYTIQRSKSTYLEISPNSTSKGKALGDLSERLDISSDNIIAFGDHDNDVTMLAYAGIGVAMANATDAAKHAARFLTSSNDCDGIVEFLESKGY